MGTILRSTFLLLCITNNLRSREPLLTDLRQKFVLITLLSLQWCFLKIPY
jgi:hypothetical protein